ncbi:hypothetical protein GOBAR_AA35018 [Gossypium barbadense]|uniref:Uncharacterized protein n=1 Tax=Gossypium barbadense TaxID=3634 RepID=A0A2P5W3Q2_GOSBA|nr:hypothetical protein GOBAR_AA35018 [Gossypium barbadense]
MRNMLFRFGVSLSLLSLLLFKSESAVSSIDLGSEWLKVAVVNLKPGQIPITIAINEMSKRKSPALVAFQSETRLLAEEAAGIVARYPDKVFSNLRDMVGKPYRDVKRFADAMDLPFDVVEDFRGAAMIRVSDDVSYSVEELLGMILKYAANLAEFHSKTMVKDMVKDVRWDSGLGGQNMELRLVEYFADEFNKQVGNGVDVRKYPKAMAKLKKQVKRTKEILSANTAAPISVESLHDDRDFRYSSRNLSSPIKTNLHFSLSRSGILSLDQAEAAFQVTEWIEVPKRNLTVENSTIASSNVSVDPGAENTSEQNSNSLESDGEISNASNSTTEPNTVDLGTEKKLKKMTFRIPLKIVEKTMGPGIPLSKESLLNAKSKLEALDKKDAERRRTAELKNNLEEYIYATKEKVQEWLYTDGEDATATEFQERLNLLKAATDPIFFRFKELTARPEAVKFARRYLTELQQTIRGWEKDKPWLPKDKVEELSINIDKFKTWLDEKEAEQQKMSGFSMPVFTSKEVYEKVTGVQNKADSIKKIPKPKPKTEKPINNAETEKDTSGDEKPAEESDSSKNEEDKVEPEMHEEL